MSGYFGIVAPQTVKMKREYHRAQINKIKPYAAEQVATKMGAHYQNEVKKASKGPGTGEVRVSQK